MTYIGTQPNNVKKNTGLYNPSEILQLTKEGSWGGSMELIQSQTVSSPVAQVDFTSIKESKYDVHLLTWVDVVSANDSKRMVLRFFESGTIETASVYQYANQVNYAGNIYTEAKSTGDNDIRINDNTGNDTAENQNGYVYCYNLGNSSKYSYTNCMSVGVASTNINWSEFGGGVLPQASTVDGIRLLIDGDYNITAGTLKLYGVKQI